MLRILSTLLLSTIALAHAGTVHAQSCGDTITHDVVLTADLHCTSGWTALYVPTSGVTIDLNGHTISGNRGLDGITLHEASSVRIVDGRIRGFRIGVNGLRSHSLGMRHMSLEDLGAGVLLNYSFGARIADNDFRAINGQAISFAGAPLALLRDARLARS